MKLTVINQSTRDEAPAIEAIYTTMLAELESVLPADTEFGLRLVGKGDGLTVQVTGVHDGKNILTANRRFDFEGKAPILDNILLELGEDFQGRGIAGIVNKAGLEALTKHGGSIIELAANIDVGGYAWLRKGFFPSDKGVLDRIILNNSSVSPDLKKKWAAMSEVEARAFVLTDEFRAYKDIMLGSNWSGKLDLNDPASKEAFLGKPPPAVPPPGPPAPLEIKAKAGGPAFKEAINYAKARNVILPAEFYGEFLLQQRSQAVSIAGLSSLEQIKFVIDQVTKVLKDGGTFKTFQDAVNSGGLDINLPRHRLDNIFRTNIQSAYSRGRWEQQSRVRGTRPYLMYDAINDSRTRPAHTAMDNTILRWDDPWWKTHYPLNGYRCRCTVISLTESQAQKRGISEAAPDGADPDRGWEYNPGEDYTTPVGKAIDAAAAELELKTNKSSAEIAEMRKRLGR